MSNDQQIAKADSAVKATLDRLELVEKVPALTHASGRALPGHPAGDRLRQRVRGVAATGRQSQNRSQEFQDRIC